MAFRPISWLIGLFRRERARIRKALLPYAITVAEDLFDQDFNGDGVVADARIELGRILRHLNVTVARGIFAEYFNADGSIKSNVIEVLPVAILKKVLAIGKLVSALRDRGWPIPLPVILKHGYSLLDTVLQDAYEEKVEP